MRKNRVSPFFISLVLMSVLLVFEDIAVAEEQTNEMLNELVEIVSPDNSSEIIPNTKKKDNSKRSDKENITTEVKVEDYISFIDMKEAFRSYGKTKEVKKQLNDSLYQYANHFEKVENNIASIIADTQELKKVKSKVDIFYDKGVPDVDMLYYHILGYSKGFDKTDKFISDFIYSGATGNHNSFLNRSVVIEEADTIIKKNKQTVVDEYIGISSERRKIRQTLKKRERTMVSEIYEDIYKLLKKYCDEKGIFFVVSKEEILYGGKAKNITEDFIKYIQQDHAKKKRKKKR